MPVGSPDSPGVPGEKPSGSYTTWGFSAGEGWVIEEN
jgi:hypothetical protein